MRDIVNGRVVVTIDRWAVKRNDGGFAPDPNRRENYGYGGPALFIDKPSAHMHMQELGIADSAAAIPVLVEIREVSLEEFKEFERKERL